MTVKAVAASQLEELSVKAIEQSVHNIAASEAVSRNFPQRKRKSRASLPREATR